MKAPWAANSVWAAAVLVAFAAGYFIADSPKAASRTADATGPGAVPALESGAMPGAAEPAAPGVANAGGGAVLPPEQARARAFEILSDGNRFQRIRRLAELLESVNGDNWRAVMDAFLVQTKTEGRVHRFEWDLLHERVGEVTGARGVEEALGDGDQARARTVLTGWAGANPKAAKAWLQGLPEAQRNALLPGLLVGLSRTEPQSAFALMAGQPQSVWDAQGTRMLDEAIQSGGFRTAEEINRAVRLDPNFSANAKGKVSIDLVDRRLVMARARGESTELLDWAEEKIGPALGPNMTRNTVSLSTKKDAPATLAWLDARTEKLTPGFLDLAYTTFASTWKAQAPEEFSGWLQGNPNHPKYGAMAAIEVNALLQAGKTAEARAMSETVRDEAQRAKLNDVIQESEQRRAGIVLPPSPPPGR